MSKWLEEFRKKALSYQHVYIYGAGFRAKVLTGILQAEIEGISFDGAVVTDRKKASIDFCWDIPIVELQELGPLRENTLFLIGTVEAYVKEICLELEAEGCRNYITVPEEVFEELKKRYTAERYKKYFGMELQKDSRKECFRKGNLITKIYMVNSEKDKKVKEPVNHPNLIAIQGGRAVSHTKTAGIGDDTGCNISQKNERLNEFTVIYWLWKNAPADLDYIGLCHYRRIFDMDSVLDKIKREQPDAVLAEPEILFPSIGEHYCSIHYSEDFALMKNILRNRYPEYFEFAERYFSQELFIPYNMMIAKNTVFADYSEWIFPLLEEIEAQWRPRGDAYEDRAAAFLGEWLTGVYFLYHRNRLKLLYSRIQLLETR